MNNYKMMSAERYVLIKTRKELLALSQMRDLTSEVRQGMVELIEDIDHALDTTAEE